MPSKIWRRPLCSTPLLEERASRGTTFPVKASKGVVRMCVCAGLWDEVGLPLPLCHHQAPATPAQISVLAPDALSPRRHSYSFFLYPDSIDRVAFSSLVETYARRETVVCHATNPPWIVHSTAGLPLSASRASDHLGTGPASHKIHIASVEEKRGAGGAR